MAAMLGMAANPRPTATGAQGGIDVDVWLWGEGQEVAGDAKPSGVATIVPARVEWGWAALGREPRDWLSPSLCALLDALDREDFRRTCSRVEAAAAMVALGARVARVG